MSLLHDALKKAEKTGTSYPPAEEAFVDQELETKKPFPLRLAILIVLFIAGILFVLSVQFLGKNKGGTSITLPAGTTPLGLAGGGGREELIAESQKAVGTGQWHLVEAGYGKLVILEPQNAEFYNNLGLALKKQGKNLQAQQQYEKALALRSDYPEALNNLGALFLSEGRLDEAEKKFLKAIEIQPQYAEPYFHLALVYEAQGIASRARENFQKFLERSPDLDRPFLTAIQERMSALENL